MPRASTSERPARAAALSAAIAALALSLAPAAHADRTAAAAAMPTDAANPFLTVYERPHSTSRLDDLTRIPEYAVYPDGTLLVQMNNMKLWRGRLTPDETLALMDFLLTDAAVPSIDMTYVIASPLADVREYTVRTRTASYTHRVRKSSIGAGPGVKSGEAALQRVDRRLFDLATRADAPYEPAQVFVASKRMDAGPAVPVWQWNDRLPFATLADATDVDRGAGAILGGVEAAAFQQAAAQGTAWRFSNAAAAFRVRPAFPEEGRLPVWTPAGAVAPPAPPTPPPAPPIVPPAVPPAVPPPAPPVPPSPAAPATDWRPDDVDYAGVQEIFRKLKRKVSGSPHGAFWDKPYEKTVDLVFNLQTRDGAVRLIEKGNGAGSNLVRALKGEPLTIVMPDGRIEHETFPVMPPNSKMPDEDIERLRRWIDHGAPKEKPGAAPSAPPPTAAPPTAAPPTAAVGSNALHLVAEGAVDLGSRSPQDDGESPPAFYVARDEASWAKVFDVWLRRHGGPNGPAISDGLKSLREATTGYDYASSALVLLVSPATDNYDWDVSLALETLTDGTARLVLSHRHERRNYVKAPDALAKWALYRTDAKVPQQVTMKASRVRVYGPSNPD